MKNIFLVISLLTLFALSSSADPAEKTNSNVSVTKIEGAIDPSSEKWVDKQNKVVCYVTSRAISCIPREYPQ